MFVIYSISFKPFIVTSIFENNYTSFVTYFVFIKKCNTGYVFTFYTSDDFYDSFATDHIVHNRIILSIEQLHLFSSKRVPYHVWSH